MITQRRTQWRSFAGGELSPEMYGRADIPRHSIGLKRCYNTLVTPQGALINRTGSQFIAETVDSEEAVLIPFIRSDGQGYLLVLGAGYGHIYLSGNPIIGFDIGDLIEINDVTFDPLDPDPTIMIFQTAAPHGFVVDTPVVLHNMSLVSYNQIDADFIASISGVTYLVRSAPTTTTFTLKRTTGKPLQHSQSDIPNIAGGFVGLEADIDAVELTTPYQVGDLFALNYAQHVDDLTVVHPLYPPARITREEESVWDYAALTFNSTLAAPANITVTAMGTPGADPIAYSYTVTATNEEGAEGDTGTPDSDDNTLRTIGNHNVVAWDAVATTFRYNIYKSIGGATYGYVGSSTGLTFVDDNISPDYTKQPPTELATFDAESEYPGAVAFHEQRLVLAGTLSEPQAFWASGLAAFDYFKAANPPRDDEAFTYELASLKASPILHALPLHELLFFTVSGVFRVASGNEAFAPTTVGSVPVVDLGTHPTAKPQSYATRILFPAARGGHLHELTSDDSLAGYAADDVSIIATHLIEGRDWVQTAMQVAPFPVWYGLRDDGILIGLTYLPDQKVYAWHQHELPGAVIESVAVIPEGATDRVYVIAKRTINGVEVRYIERLAEQFLQGDELSSAFFVDAGVSYEFDTETTEITGLDHLEGEEVIVLADAYVQGPFTVTAGGITLDTAALVVNVGLAYTSEIETMPIMNAEEAGFGMGIAKNISQVWLRIKETLGITAGASFDDEHQQEMPARVDELVGDDPTTRGGVVDITALGTWGDDATVCVKQSKPLPFTITGMAADYVNG